MDLEQLFIGREHDAIVGAPTSAICTAGAGQCGNPDRRVTGHRHALEHATGEEADPLTIRGEEGLIGALCAVE